MVLIPRFLPPGERPARRFHVMNVGLPKTGTTSLAGIFSEYRSGHEFMFPEMMQSLGDRALGIISADEFRKLVIERDQLGYLEMDSVSFAWSYVDLLAAEFPQARFIFTIRDCFSWLDSILNLALFIGPGMDEFLFHSGHAMLNIPMKREHLVSRTCFLENLPTFLDGFLEYWSRGNELALANLPKGRSLVLRTHEIAARMPDIAAFAGVSPDTLRADRTHLFPAPAKYGLLADLDPDFLQGRVDQRCAGLMDHFFPGHRLADFLAGRSPRSAG